VAGWQGFPLQRRAGTDIHTVRCSAISVSLRESPGRGEAARPTLSDLNLRSCLRGRPVVRQKLGEPGNGMGGDAGEDILEPGEGKNMLRPTVTPRIARSGGVMPTPGLCRAHRILGICCKEPWW